MVLMEARTIDFEDLVEYPKLTGRFSEGSGYDATPLPCRWSLHYCTMDLLT